MATRAELVADSTEWLQEALRVLLRLEALQDSLAFAYWQMGILRSVVQPLVAAGLGRRDPALHSRYVTRQFVRDDHSRLTASCGEHTPQEGDRRLLVAALLDQD